ncbi:MAG: carboxypeptidase-like regulatory domain-containing protein [Candidatus Stahlbacteria bacterium]|nr:carboxypeptidase-like regulatory domain-containing protein [Candidatus Stahlbacteria bacterium]
MNLLLTFLCLVYPVNTDDLNTDGKGLFYNISPILPEKGTLYLLVNPSLAYGRRTGPCDTTSVLPNDPKRKPPDKHLYGVGTVGAGYVILPQLEVFVGVHGYGDYIKREDWPTYRADTRYIAFPQFLAAIKTGFPQVINPDYTLSFGFLVWYAHWLTAIASIPHPDIRKEFDFAPATQHDMEVGIRGMTALQSPIGTTFLNLGYFRVVKATSADTGTSGQFGFNSFGIGQELDMWTYVRPSIEIAKQDTFGSLIPQVKILIPYCHINFGLNIPVFKNFDWVPNDTIQKTARSMISIHPYIVLKRPPKPKPTIIIEGTVFDSLSLDPIPATISFMGPVSGKITTKNGQYKLAFIKEGAYQVGVETPDFKWEQRVFHLMEYDTVKTDWSVKRKVNWSIMGKVVDVVTKKGVPASVRLAGKKSRETYTDPASGEFKIWTNAGDYEFQIAADGYHNEAEKIKITNDETLDKTIYLLPTQYPREAKAKFMVKKEGKKGRGR